MTRAGAHHEKGSGSSQSPHLTTLSQLPCAPTMTDKSQQRKNGGRVFLKWNVAIDDLNITKKAMSATPAYPLFDSVATLITTIRVSSFLFRDEMCEAYT